jgi:hypothetical protein
MTTGITVNALGGCQVQVLRRLRNDPPGKHSEEILVQPGARITFSLWGDNELLIREMRKPDPPAKA